MNDRKWVYVLFNNGREIDNIESPEFDTPEEAAAAIENALDDVCPRGSNMRRFYRGEVGRAPIQCD